MNYKANNYNNEKNEFMIKSNKNFKKLLFSQNLAQK